MHPTWTDETMFGEESYVLISSRVVVGTFHQFFPIFLFLALALPFCLVTVKTAAGLQCMPVHLCEMCHKGVRYFLPASPKQIFPVRLPLDAVLSWRRRSERAAAEQQRKRYPRAAGRPEWTHGESDVPTWSGLCSSNVSLFSVESSSPSTSCCISLSLCCR